jgi:ferrochelatase
MKGVLIVNMGGPQSLKEMRFFLSNMFNDESIIPYPKPFRVALAWLISTLRYKKSWKKYLSIGGSPIVDDTKTLAKLASVKLGSEYKVDYAFSYSNPLIKDALKKLVNSGVDEIYLVPLYPHYSISTWQSVVNDAKKAISLDNIKLEVIRPFYKNKKYIEFLSNAIIESINNQGFDNPLLLFSAHSIPNALIDKGDTYESEINESAKLIANNLNLKYTVSYQSQVGENWLGPITKDVLSELDSKGEDELLIIPISFVGENLETLYDIDRIMIPEAENLNMKISRMKFSTDQSLLANSIVEEIKR